MPLFNKKKKKKVSWGKDEVEPQKNRKTLLFKPTFSMPKLSIGKIRIPLILTLKRILGAVLLIVNLACFFAIAPVQEGIGLFFFMNGFVLLDYLWKTRKGK